MNCSKIQNLLSAYMDGELAGEEQLQIRRHLAECYTCSQEHESLLTTKRMISSLSVREARPGLDQMILGMLAEEEQTRARRSPILAWWSTLPINRRLQFAGALALGAVALAGIRIVPILTAPSRPQPRAFLAKAPSSRTTYPTVGDALYLHNPGENAPLSGGAMPVNVTQYSDLRSR